MPENKQCCEKCKDKLVGNPELGYVPQCSMFGNCPCHSSKEEELIYDSENFVKHIVKQEDWEKEIIKKWLINEKKDNWVGIEEDDTEFTSVSLDGRFDLEELCLSLLQKNTQDVKEGIIRDIKNFRFSVPVGEGKFTTLYCADCKEQRYACKQCLIDLLEKI